MKREEVYRLVKQMERLRHGLEECKRNERSKINREYASLWSIIKPYVEGTEPYSK